ncbi:XIAP-associated factor 1 isoform X11 [Notamacropus eugenii]|uniref:XIAP-associated factor 1 isoform X11 n=1 Tax=Notamacropus eugenii TaxID=9315 RepID=UPI003B6823C5
MEGDLQLCTNCEKEVPSDYFFLHEAHCLRFRVICPECKEVILKEEMKDHQENGHKQLTERKLAAQRADKTFQKQSLPSIGLKSLLQSHGMQNQLRYPQERGLSGQRRKEALHSKGHRAPGLQGARRRKNMMFWNTAPIAPSCCLCLY